MRFEGERWGEATVANCMTFSHSSLAPPSAKLRYHLQINRETEADLNFMWNFPQSKPRSEFIGIIIKMQIFPQTTHLLTGLSQSL